MKARKNSTNMSGLVIAALRNLREAQGSTAKQIMKHIMAEYNASEATVQKQLKTALKRGVEYGILRKTNTGYCLNNSAEVMRPVDLAQMDSCGKKKRPCPKIKRRCPKKRKRNACCPKKRSSCPKKRKRNPCNTCASRGRRGNCNQQPIRLVNEGAPNQDETSIINENDTDKRSLEDEQDQDQEQDQQMKDSRSRSTSRVKTSRNRSRSQSLGRSKYSGSDGDDDQ